MAGGSNERQKARPGASLEAMIPRGRYLTLKLRALCWVLRRLRAACDASGRAAEKFSKVRATNLEELILKARYADVDGSGTV